MHMVRKARYLESQMPHPPSLSHATLGKAVCLPEPYFPDPRNRAGAAAPGRGVAVVIR